MQENNKLIAEFMGMTNHHNDKSMMITKTSQGNEVIPIDSLEYNSSWDWIMPVVQKIEQYCEGVPQQMLNISLYSDIKEVYKAVIEFIKNQNN
tara:strand:- start:224 stop:502 length:279 start_codon:yes stop_codon:yes gene_type:complete